MAKIDRVLIGEALVGDFPEIAHIDLMIGPRGSAVEQAFCNALANQRAGHTNLLAVVTPNLLPKPVTLMVPKVTIKGAPQALQMFGPAQAAVAKAVMECVEEGIIPKEEAEDVFIIAAVYIQWDAKDNKKIYEYNYQAVKTAIQRAVNGEPKVDQVLEQYRDAIHPLA